VTAADLFPLVLLLHRTTAALTIGFFLWRARQSLRDPLFTRQKAMRYSADSIDTVLFLSGLWLLLQGGHEARAELWLQIKFAFLLGYILCGMAAFRFLKELRARLIALVAALLCFAAVVLTALTRGALFGIG